MDNGLPKKLTQKFYSALIHRAFRASSLSVSLAILLFYPCLCSATSTQTSKKSIFDTLSIYWENDIFSGTDRDYTNGLKLTWSTPFLKDKESSKLPDWAYSLLDYIPFAYDPDSDHAMTISLGQNIYTPEETERYDLILDDRPYAGHMYLGAGIHTRTKDRKQTWEINLGIVGPASRADDAQKWLHEQTGSDPANGWGNQLENEPTIDVIFESKWKLHHLHVTRNTILDIIPHLGGRVGNVAVYANTGLEIRYGWNLPDNFGVCTIRGGCELNSAFNGYTNKKHSSIYLFTSADGRAVAYDLFLDGNTFRDSHHVDKEPLVGDLIVGIGFSIGSVTSNYSYIFQTRQFKEQNSAPEYGAISLSVSY